MTPFPISSATPITYAAPVPKRADAVVIGGGGYLFPRYLERKWPA